MALKAECESSSFTEHVACSDSALPARRQRLQVGRWRRRLEQHLPFLQHVDVERALRLSEERAAAAGQCACPPFPVGMSGASGDNVMYFRFASLEFSEAGLFVVV